MTNTEENNSILSEHVLEVRHAASGSFLDVRGYVADYIREKSSLPHWNIETNVVNFRDLPNDIEKEGAFAGYKSAGYIVNNPETRNFFEDRSGSFWNTLLKNAHYRIPNINRLGVRTKAFIPRDLEFSDINDLIFTTFFSDKARDIIGGKETDLQFIIDISEGKFKAKLRGGPIKENEVSNYLRFDSEKFNNCGIFLDIDFYKINDIKHNQVPKLIKEAMNLTWSKIDNIVNGLGL